jgi:hypothetical protein
MWPMLLATAGMAGMQSLGKGRQAQMDTWKQNTETAGTNVINGMQALRTIQSLEVQRGAVRQQTAKNLHLAERAAFEAEGTAGAVIAATGIKGASVDAVMSDIDRELGEVNGELQMQHIAEEFNINQQIESVSWGAQFGMAPLLRNISNKEVWQAAAGSAIMAAGSMYANQYFKFGSGTDNGATVPGTTVRRG